MDLAVTSVERRGRIAVVRLDRKDGRNALSLAAIRELTRVARDLDEDDGLSAVVLTGSAKVFSFGFDLTDPKLAEITQAGVGTRRRASQLGGKMCRAWEQLEPLTICAVEGHCIGGGVALAISCDLVVAAESARFIVPEIDRGMNLGWGAVPRLVNLVGPARAKQIAIVADQVSAVEAERLGLVQELAPEGKALDRALAMAEKVAAKPPVAVRMIKQGVNAYAGALTEAASRMDSDQFALATLSADFAEGISSFLQKRPPKFTGR